MSEIHVLRDARARLIRVWPGISVWQAVLDLPSDSIGYLFGLLSQDEDQRANVFGRAELRDRFIARRGILRLLLSKACAFPADKIEFRCSEFGKPEWANGGKDSPQFSVSSSGGMGLFAFSCPRAVGVDIERVESGVDIGGIAADYFTRAESETYFQTPEPERGALFYTFWTRKEACAKSVAAGLAESFRFYDVAAPTGQTKKPLIIRPPNRSDVTLSVYDLDVETGFRAALAVVE